MSPDTLLYEYAVVRCVPRLDREEFFNIGLIMLCKRQKWLKGKITIDPCRLKVLDPDLDIRLLEKQSEIFCSQEVPFRDYAAEEKYRWLTAAKSAVLQTGASHPGVITISENEEIGIEKETLLSLLENEFNRLYSMLVLR